MRSTQPRLVTEPTTKPIEAPPRHSSTPTCTRAIGACASAQRSGTPSMATAMTAARCERRIGKTPIQIQKRRSRSVAHALYATTGSAASKKRPARAGLFAVCRCVFTSAVTTMMNAAVIAEANRLELDSGNAGGDIQAGLSLHADRLQRVGVARTADQEVTAAADADRRIGADPAVIASKLAIAEARRRRADRPGKLRLRGNTEIEANAPHGRNIGFGTAARALEHAFQIGD